MEGGRDRAGETSGTTLTSLGIMLLGVLVSIGLTVGFGVTAAWWVRVVAGVAAVTVLAVSIELGTASQSGLLARLSAWIQNAP